MSFLDRFTPRASRRTRLLMASLLWSGIGLGLLAAGCNWLVRAPSGWWLAGLPIALALGYAKGRFVLAPRAEANAARIVLKGEQRCVGGAFGWGSWALAAVMMGAGFALRRSPLPRHWLGLLYSAIGAALLSASATSWSRWRLARRDDGPRSRV